jgi:primosomal protein N' (replication factor Y)
VLLADVALPVPIAHAFTYAVPEALAAQARPGVRVVCPFGARRLVGVLLTVREGAPPESVKPLARVLDVEPALPEDELAFLRDLASYYFAPIGEAVRLALPPVEREAAREVAAPTLFGQVRGVGSRRVQWVAPTACVEVAGALRGQAAAILAHVRAVGATPVAKLEQRWRSARSAVQRLSAAGLVTLEERESPSDPFFADPAPRDAPHHATPAQADAIAAISRALSTACPKGADSNALSAACPKGADSNALHAAGAATSVSASAPSLPSGLRTFLLHGVTGSGKTEVYLRAIAAAREQGRGSIVLLPEIALTPQLVARFRARFGDDVAVLHSALTPRERYGMWHRLRSGAVDVAIGARSALFAPVRALGLVIVDEEHDPSFKQEDGVRYHARDMAIWRAHRVGGVCVLGSATPSLESEQLTRTGRATKLRLPARARAQPLPRVELVDLRRIGPGPTGDKRISMALFRAIEETLGAREQVILFLNRRGFAPAVRCEACGQLASCESCSVALTFHKRAGVVRCHYCDFEAPLASRCAHCAAEALALEGLGTEKLEETLAAAFPAARVARLDRDVAGGRKGEAILARMRAREIDLLVGTQMVAKGHDLPNVTLVGVVNADAALGMPDYRASERAFQLLVQVAGRAGRGDAPGRVLVQTWDPDHPAIALGARHDVDAFLERELADRRELGYPPLTRAALVRVDGLDEDEARAACDRLARLARASEPVRRGAVLVQGPAAAPVARVRGRYRFRVMLRALERPPLRAVLGAIDEARTALPRGIRAVIDVDPVQLL